MVTVLKKLLRDGYVVINYEKSMGGSPYDCSLSIERDLETGLFLIEEDLGGAVYRDSFAHRKLIDIYGILKDTIEG